MRGSVVPGVVAAVLWNNLLCACEPACEKALLETIRAKPGQALGFFEKKLVDEMEKVAVEKKKDGYHWTGAYRVNPAKKATYLLFVGIVDDRLPLRGNPKAYLTHGRVFQGSFEMKDGRWIATVPTYKYTLLD
jgi:hypothetical protein